MQCRVVTYVARNLFNCRVPVTWKSLPLNVTGSQTLKAFKANYGNICVNNNLSNSSVTIFYVSGLTMYLACDVYMWVVFMYFYANFSSARSEGRSCLLGLLVTPFLLMRIKDFNNKNNN